MSASVGSCASSTRVRGPRRCRVGSAVGTAALALLALQPIVAPGWGRLRAQVPVEPASAAPAGHCLSNARWVRALGGGVLGGWLGFVTAKITLSDWHDGSRTAAAHRMRVRSTAAGAALGAVIGLVVPSSGCGRDLAKSAAPRLSRLPITADEIRRRGAGGTVYDAVYALRRSWLNVRGVEDMNEAPRVSASDPSAIVPGEPELIVYLDNMKLGTLSVLHDLPTVGVIVIRYYDPAQANLRWGVGHSHGAIQVVTILENGGGGGGGGGTGGRR